MINAKENAFNKTEKRNVRKACIRSVKSVEPAKLCAKEKHNANNTQLQLQSNRDKYTNYGFIECFIFYIQWQMVVRVRASCISSTKKSSDTEARA